MSININNGDPQYWALPARSKLGRLLLRGGTTTAFEWSESWPVETAERRTTPTGTIGQHESCYGGMLLLEGKITFGPFARIGKPVDQLCVTATYTRIAAHLFPGDECQHTANEMLAEYHRLTSESL